MLYCIRMDVRVPHALAPEQLERLEAEEKARAQELQRDGRWRHLTCGVLRGNTQHLRRRGP
jgi:muconolactone D-isomerase